MKTIKENWNELISYQTEGMTIGNMEPAKEFSDKINFVKAEVKQKLHNAIPPELDIAMRMKLYGVTEDEFFKMKERLGLSVPEFVKIANHLRDLWRQK